MQPGGRHPILRPAPQGAVRRVALLATLALSSTSLGGCYVYRPLSSAPVPQTRVVIEINDRGRIELEHNVGPDVAMIEGTLRDVSDSLYVLSVREVRSLYRSSVRWNGETVRIRTANVRQIRERAYSKPHTFALVTALASSTLAFVATRGLFGGGSDRSLPGGPDLPPPEN